MSEPSLTLVTDRRRLAGRDLPSLVREAALAGVDQVQVREKDLPGGVLRALVAEAVAAAAGTRTRILVNGRPDVAQVAGAYGVQLPDAGLPVAEVRRAFPGLVLGASCHTLDEVSQAEQDGADFVVLGPIFATPGKEGRALGVDTLAQAAASVRIPVHAIGGIDAWSARRAVEGGARGLAAIRAFLDGPVDAMVRRLRGSA